MRVRGPVRREPTDRSAADFLARPAGSRAEASVGRQSQPLIDRVTLDHAVDQARERITDDPTFVDPGWMLYTLIADTVEFWQGDKERRHTRLRYARGPAGWARELLWPWQDLRVTLPDDVDAVVFDCDGLLVDTETEVFAAEDVEHAKPAPDLYLAACGGLGAAPARSVAFEDSRTGVASAHAAGLYVIGVPSLPGVVLDTDAVFTALTDPSLAGWAATVGGREGSRQRLV